MDLSLKDRKLLNNSSKNAKQDLPHYFPGKPDWTGAVTTGVSGIGNLVANMYGLSLFTTTPEEYQLKYGSTQGDVNGIGYTRYNDIDKLAELSLIGAENTANEWSTTLSGAATGAATGGLVGGVPGAVIGGFIGGIGGLLGSSIAGDKKKEAAKKSMAIAQDRNDRMGEMNMNHAKTLAMQLDQAKRYGIPGMGTLFSYHNGKPSESKNLVNTSEGLQPKSVYGFNSFTEKGEVINLPGESSAPVDRGQNDTAESLVYDDTRVLNGKYADAARPWARAQQFINNQMGKSKKNDAVYSKLKLVAQNKVDQIGEQFDRDYYLASMQNKAKNGIPRYSDGHISPWYNIASGALGGVAGLSQFLLAYNDAPYKPDTFVGNKYERRGLNTLAGLRINPYSIIPSLRNAEARTAYAANASGGLNTAQKRLFRQSGLYSTQLSIANALQQIQALNNQYQAAYADAALKYGEAEAQRRQQAQQYNLEYFTRAHAARQQGMQMGIRNMLDSFNQYAANEFKRQQGNYMLDIYRQRGEYDRLKIDRQMENGSNYSVPKINPVPGSTVITPSKTLNKYLASDTTDNWKRLLGVPVYDE